MPGFQPSTSVSRNRHSNKTINMLHLVSTPISRRPNCPFGTAVLDSVQLRIWHSPRFCPRARQVSVWLTTSSVSQRASKRTTMRVWLGWTEISSYLPTLISKEIGMICSALQPSSPWFPYSTSIVWHVSRRLRVLSRASGLTASQATESALYRQRHSPYRRRSPRQTHCLYSSTMQMWNDSGRIRCAPFVVPLQCRAHSALSNVV